MARGTLICAAVVVAAAVALTGNASGAVTRTTGTDPYLFDDEFNGTGLPDPAKWSITSRCSRGYDHQETCFNPANVYRDGHGNLVLAVTRGTMGRAYDGVSIQTFQEGGWPPPQVLVHLAPPVHIEARIKFAGGAGLWGAFWLNSNASSASNLELDVQEFRGAVPAQHTCHTHILREWSATIDTGFDGSAAFHTYWVDYYPDHVVFGVDGLRCGQTTIPAAPPGLIRLWNLVGRPGTWGGLGGRPRASAIPALMIVDYVRAWGI